LCFQGVLNDGNVVSIKPFLKSPVLSWARSYDIHLLISKLQNKNVVKIMGYVAPEVQTPSFSWVSWFFKWKEHPVTERECFWVEEYVPNGSLDKIIYGMFPLKHFITVHVLAKFLFSKLTLLYTVRNSSCP